MRSTDETHYYFFVFKRRRLSKTNELERGNEIKISDTGLFLTKGVHVEVECVRLSSMIEGPTSA